MKKYPKFNLLIYFIIIVFSLILPKTEKTIVKANNNEYKNYLPLVTYTGQALPYGIESYYLHDEKMHGYAQELAPSWLRANIVQWQLVQPEKNGSYNTAVLERLDKNIAFAKQNNITPIIVITRSPSWATTNGRTCGPIRQENMSDFTKFMSWLVNRYKNDVNYWELWNEPDFAPGLIPIGSEVMGCWGNESDPYYGGGAYGEMLKAVAPVIRKANPQAKIVLGGLALTHPVTQNPAQGNPEKFLEGILRSGAGASFDIMAFHSYPWFSHRPLDYDYDADTEGSWKEWGGYTIGKVKFIRQVFTKYKVPEKPLFLNETALTCVQPPNGPCPGPGENLDRAQVYFLIRMLARGSYVGIDQFSWYLLEGPGWRYSGLLDNKSNPKPVYTAYQTFIRLIGKADSPQRVTVYDRDDTLVETYRFTKTSSYIDVLWGKDLSTYYVLKPAKFIKAYDVYGEEIQPIGPYIPVSFGAIYIEQAK